MVHSTSFNSATTLSPIQASTISINENYQRELTTDSNHIQTFVLELVNHYNLVKPKGCKPTMVYFVVFLKGRQVKVSTGCKVYPNQWANGRASVGKHLSVLDCRNNEVLNSRIDLYNQRFNEYKILVNCAQIEISKETLKHYIISGLKMEKKKEVINLSEILKNYITNDRTIEESTRGNRLREVEKLESFLNGRVLNSYSELNTRLFREFQQWLIKNVEGKNEDGTASPATLNKVVKNIISTIKKYLVANEVISMSQLNDIIVTPIKEKKNDNKIALTEDEIHLLHSYKCETERDEQVRDLFLLECTTGQRFSDVDKVTSNVIHKDGRTYINLIQDKTKAPIQVDILFELALDIVKKYKYSLPTVTNKLLNERIKVIAKQAGITGKEESISDNVDKSKVVSITRERYDCVCSHTGRNTFVTMLALRGWHYNEIGRYTGHKKIETVQHYDKSKTGTKYKVMYEALQKERPYLLLGLIGEKKKDLPSTPDKVAIALPEVEQMYEIPESRVKYFNTLFAYDHIKLAISTQNVQSGQQIKLVNPDGYPIQPNISPIIKCLTKITKEQERLINSFVVDPSDLSSIVYIMDLLKQLGIGVRYINQVRTRAIQLGIGKG